MSDNVIRPERWLANAAASLEAEASDAPTDVELGGGGSGPHDPDMEPRVAALEADMKELKASQQRVEVVLSRIEETLQHVATKTELVKIEGKVDALDARVGRVDRSVDTALQTAIGKAIGPVQFLAILTGAATILGAVAAVYAWASHQPSFTH